MRAIAVRKARGGDAQAIAEIYNHAVAHTTATFDLESVTTAARRDWLAQSSTLLVLVATSDDHVLGWASLVRWSARGAYEHTAEASVYVAPQAQRTGVGLVLGQALLDHAPELRLHVIVAQICTENSGGKALAERLGFEHAGVLQEVGFKFGRWLDVAIYQIRAPLAP
jgi:L-amino acid N-acyltransferase YncA